jgi:hypothetical protein
VSPSPAPPTVRRLLLGGAAGVVVGIAASVLEAPALGGPITVGSLALLAYAVHALGRTGTDPSRSSSRRRRRAPT